LGPQYIADAWINEVKWLEMRIIRPRTSAKPSAMASSSGSCVRTLRRCVYLHRFQILAKARRIDGEFIAMATGAAAMTA